MHYRQHHPVERKTLGRVPWTSEARHLCAEVEFAMEKVFHGEESILVYLSNPLEKILDGYRCPICKQVFRAKCEGKKHLSRKHSSADPQALEMSVPIVRSVCGRWIDVEAAMKEYPSQRETLRNILGLATHPNGAAKAPPTKTTGDGGYFTKGFACGGACNYVSLNIDMICLHQRSNACGGLKRKVALCVQEPEEVSSLRLRKKLRLVTREEIKAIEKGDITLRPNDKPKWRSLPRPRNRYIATKDGYFIYGWKCGEPCDYLCVKDNSIYQHRLRKKCKGTKTIVTLFVAYNTLGEKRIDRDKIRLATTEEIKMIEEMEANTPKEVTPTKEVSCKTDEGVATPIKCEDKGNLCGLYSLAEVAIGTIQRDSMVKRETYIMKDGTHIMTTHS